MPQRPYLTAALLAAVTLAPAACEMMRETPRQHREEARATRSPAPPSGGGSGTGPTLKLTQVEAQPGGQATVNAVLQTGGQDIAGTQNDIEFGSQVRIAAGSDGQPDCSANRRIGKDATAFTFLPNGCRGSGRCTTVRALVLSVSNVRPIANDSVLYTCTVAVDAKTKAGSYKLQPTHVAFSSPDGKAINGHGVDGLVTVR